MANGSFDFDKLGKQAASAISGRTPAMQPYQAPEAASPGAQTPTDRLMPYPPPERWDDWEEYESTAWPKKVKRRYQLTPTLCFNCEAACGLLAYVDKDTKQIRKIEGNPLHPASRGRNCAKGWVTVNQVYDPERIFYPLKRSGARGEGKWQRLSWDEVLDDIAGRMRALILEERRNEIMYHIGRPGEDGYVMRVLQAWGADGHNSHTNVCSASARLGQALWCGADRPSPDFAKAQFIFLISSHLETGHYFNPHAQRIMEAQKRGAKIAVIDPRLSNTASKADYWLPAYPGTEGAILLSIVRYLLNSDMYDAEFVRNWFNWQEYLRAAHAQAECTFETFIAQLKALYAPYTFAYAEQESGVSASLIEEVAREVGLAGSRLAVHIWRAAASGNLWGWMIARCLYFLPALTGAIGTPGGTNLNTWDKFTPKHPNPAPPPQEWNELIWPHEYPLAHYEMSFLLPHLLLDGRGKIGVYFSRVYNPVWTNPDGFSWLEVLCNEELIGMHVALTPTWNESAWFADYVLPMGIATERHDTQSQETHPGKWIGFRQPVGRVVAERAGQRVEHTYETNPGEVWEHNEFWIELSWRVDPDGSLGIRRYFESPYRPGEKISINEYYQWMFENGVPGLPEAAAAQEMTPLDYMRRYGVYSVEEGRSEPPYTRAIPASDAAGAAHDPQTGIVSQDGAAIGLRLGDRTVAGFGTPSKRLEFYSQTLVDWKWPEYALPTYVPGHVHWRDLDRDGNEFDLLPNFRLPALIHTRSTVKWLYEISHDHPLLVHPADAQRLGINTGDLAKVTTAIGYFISRARLSEGIRPGVLALSHHLGRWRLQDTVGVSRMASALVNLERDGQTGRRLRQINSGGAYETDDPDTKRVWWNEVGVHQNLAFPVQPDPVSGMHCWHQRVRVEKAGPDDQYGDVYVDLAKSRQCYQEWLAMTRPAPGPGNLRRPRWLNRPLKPVPEAFVMPSQ